VQVEPPLDAQGQEALEAALALDASDIQAILLTALRHVSTTP
jgi:cytochrome c-type biogenesis protein CcmH/NrfG